MNSRPKPPPDTNAGDHLEAVFQAVLDEARANPKFAARLREALSDTTDASKAVSTPNRKKSANTPTPDVHAINILRKHGEQMLRGRLSGLRSKSDLLKVAKRSGLRFTGKAAKRTATRDDLIEGIIVAAKYYDSQRRSADG